jgi:putative phosphoesterase
MRIGLVSDSHGKVDRLGRAMECLAAVGVDAIVHCGDIGSVKCMQALAAAGVPAYAVAGNMDRHLDDLAVEAATLGIRFSPRTVEVPLGDGQYLVATHGHREDVLRELIGGGQFPYVCHGHTHRRRDEHVGDVRVLNPGALRHPRCGNAPAVMLLDTDRDELTVIAVGS